MLEPKRIKEKFKELNFDSEKEYSGPTKKQKVDNNPKDSQDSLSIF